MYASAQDDLQVVCYKSLYKDAEWLMSHIANAGIMGIMPAGQVKKRYPGIAGDQVGRIDMPLSGCCDRVALLVDQERHGINLLLAA